MTKVSNIKVRYIKEPDASIKLEVEIEHRILFHLTVPEAILLIRKIEERL